MARASTIMAKVDSIGWLSPYKELYRQHDKAIPATFATVATVLSGGVSTVNQLGEPIGAFVMIGLSCLFAVLSGVTWKGISKHSTLTRFIKIAGLSGFFLWSVVWTVITWRNKPKDKWTNFTWDDIATIQSYLTYLAVVSWRWLAIIVAIVVAFLLGRFFSRQSVSEPPAPEPPTEQGAGSHTLEISDSLHGCQDQWLHEKAQTDKTSIEKLIRIVGILYNPDFEKAHIDFTLCVFNISLYDIAIDNEIKKGAIRFGEDDEKFFYPANIESEHPIDCPSRGDAFFVIRQAIRAEEMERLRKQDNYLIRFYDLEIMFQGGKHFPQAEPLRLDVREHYVETQKRMWRAWDQAGFVFGYNDEQWAVIQSGHTDRLAEIEELKAKLKEAEAKPPLAPPDIHAPQAPYFAWVGKQTEVGKYIKIGTADYTSFCNVQRAAFLDLYLKPFTDSVGEVNITADITFIGEKYSDRVSAAMWYGRDAATVPIRHNVTQTLFIALFDRFFTTYENQHKNRPLSNRITLQIVYAHIHVFGEYQDSYQEKQKLNLNWWVRLSRDDKTPAIERLDEDGFKLAISTLTPPDR